MKTAPPSIAKTMKLTARFASLIIVLVLAIGASCFAGLRSLALLDHSLVQVVEKDMQRLLVITNVRKQFRSMVVLEREHLLEKGAAERRAMTAKMLTNREDLGASLGKYDALAMSEDGAPLLALRGTFGRWVALDDRVLALSDAAKSDEAYALAQAHAADPVSWESLIAALVKRNEQRLAEQTAATRSTYRTARTVLVGVGVVATLVACLAGTLVFLGIKRTTGEVAALNANLEQLTAVEIALLSTAWRTRLTSIQDFFNDDALGILEIREAEHAAVLDSLRNRRDYADILSSVESWSWGRTAEFLTRLRAQSERVATRLGKPVAVHIEHNALRTPTGPLDAFWPTLIHVVRNAIDHGIEDGDERVAAGKSREGQLRMTTRLDADRSLLVEITDDGRGLDIPAIQAAAERQGMPAGTLDEITAALFTDGLTTRQEVTETSGRGVGMGAVRQACENAGGHVTMTTAHGEGTAFVFRIPPIQGMVASVRPIALAASKARTFPPRAA